MSRTSVSCSGVREGISPSRGKRSDVRPSSTPDTRTAPGCARTMAFPTMVRGVRADSPVLGIYGAEAIPDTVAVVVGSLASPDHGINKFAEVPECRRVSAISRSYWIRRSVYGLMEIQDFGVRRCLQFGSREMLAFCRRRCPGGELLRDATSNVTTLSHGGWVVERDPEHWAVVVASKLTVGISANDSDGIRFGDADTMAYWKWGIVDEFVKRHRDLLRIEEVRRVSRRDKGIMDQLFRVAFRFSY